MDNAPKTGDVTLDFVYEMLPYHEGAIQMAKSILIYTNNAKLHAVVKNIMTTQ